MRSTLAVHPNPNPNLNPSPNPSPSPSPDQVKLMERLKEQKSLMLQAEHRLNQMVTMLNEKRTNEAGEQDMRALLQRLEQEVTRMRESSP